VNDYPMTIATVNLVEPAPRRIRAVLAGETVLDTIRALYVWEWPNCPQYYIPVADVRRDLLVDEHRVQHSPLCAVEAYGLRVRETIHPDLAWAYDFPTREVLPIAGLISFYNERVDIFVDGKKLERPKTHFFPSTD
jgi:uncharacterized protein (DUF427 family)